jgi:hypothetical protein
MHRKNLLVALKVALVVGIVLNLINNHDIFLGSEITLKSALKIALNFCVPFFVSLYSSEKISKTN